jgi:hypothetical protein
MIVEGIAFAGAMLITAALGVPIAVSAAQPHRWRRPAARDRAGIRTMQQPHVVLFTPLDLGPDPVKWPSERVFERDVNLPIPRWPSQGWDDEHFGQHWKKVDPDVEDRGFHAMAARGAGTEPPSARTAGPSREERATAATAARETRAQQASASRPVRAQPQQQPRRTQQQPARRSAQPPQQQRASPPAAARPASGPQRGPPDEAEVEHLIATVGLAGTVQAIMARTGWEFREAAQYLARVRRDR